MGQSVTASIGCAGGIEAEGVYGSNIFLINVTRKIAMGGNLCTRMNGCGREKKREVISRGKSTHRERDTHRHRRGEGRHSLS